MRFAVVIAMVLAAAPLSALAQQAQQNQQPSAPAPVKPYKPVAITLPEPLKDPSFEAFRGKLADAARKRDRAALARLVVAKGFFWERENGEGADKRKSGFDNLAATLALKNNDAAGWDMIAAFADDPTASAAPNIKGAVCAPGDPGFDRKAFGALLDATQTDVFEWGFPVSDGVEARASGMPSAPVIDKLGMHFVRVLSDDSPAAAVASAVKVALPSGKTGFVPADQIAPLGNDQICYAKEGGDWKVRGYIGAGDPQ